MDALVWLAISLALRKTECSEPDAMAHQVTTIKNYPTEHYFTAIPLNFFFQTEVVKRSIHNR